MIIRFFRTLWLVLKRRATWGKEPYLPPHAMGMDDFIGFGGRDLEQQIQRAEEVVNIRGEAEAQQKTLFEEETGKSVRTNNTTIPDPED